MNLSIIIIIIIISFIIILGIQENVPNPDKIARQLDDLTGGIFQGFSYVACLLGVRVCALIPAVFGVFRCAPVGISVTLLSSREGRVACLCGGVRPTLRGVFVGLYRLTQYSSNI